MKHSEWLVSVAMTAVVLLSSYAASPGTAAAQSVTHFQDTQAAKAFKAKDYEKAAEEFRKLRDANPGNTLVLRYLAITLDHLGQYDEALAIYRDALRVAPDSPELYYHMGVTLYNAKQGGQAVVAFKEAAQLAPQSRYRDLSLRYLDAIAEQLAQRQTPGAPRRFGAYLFASYQHDDNILAAPDGNPGTTDGGRYSGYINLDYYLVRSPKWQLSASANGYGSWYDEEEFSEFEYPQYQGSLRLQNTGSLGRFPSLSSVAYTYQNVEDDKGERYSRSNSLTLGLRLNLFGDTATYGFYRYTDDVFEDKGFDPVFSSRDADNHVFGLRQTWYFAERQGFLSAELNYERNLADGTNFEMEGVGGELRFRYPLPGGLNAELSAGYTKEEYDKFAGPVIRETNRRQAGVGLSKWFGDSFYSRIEYNYLEEDSSYDQLTYDRSVWGLSMSYVY